MKDNHNDKKAFVEHCYSCVETLVKSSINMNVKAKAIHVFLILENWKMDAIKVIISLILYRFKY